jgi:hypothetical protein
VRTRAIFDLPARFLSCCKFKSRIQRVHEGFPELPSVLVLAVMWLAGIALIGLSMLPLYLFWLLLQMVRELSRT